MYHKDIYIVTIILLCAILGCKCCDKPHANTNTTYMQITIDIGDHYLYESTRYDANAILLRCKEVIDAGGIQRIVITDHEKRWNESTDKMINEIKQLAEQYNIVYEYVPAYSDVAPE